MEFLTFSFAISNLFGVLLRSDPNMLPVDKQNKYFQHIILPTDAVVRVKECHNPPFQYTTDWLRNMSTRYSRPLVCVQTELCSAGIYRQFNSTNEKKIKKRRGKRAGRRKQKNITVRVFSRVSKPCVSKNNVNKNNTS